MARRGSGRILSPMEIMANFWACRVTLDIDYYDQLNADGTNEESTLYRGAGGTSGQPISPGNYALDTEDCGDIPHLSIYASPGFTQDYDVGNATIGNWANYTRIYPACTYNIYMRAAAGNGSVSNALSLSLVSGDTTTSNQVATNILGTFSVPGTSDYQTYAWAPLANSDGQVAQVSFDGSSTYTLRANWNNTGFNINYYMFVPANTTLPVISNLYPNGQYQFQNSSDLTFNAASSAGFDPGEISVQLTGTNLLGQAFITNFTSANGLIITGPSTNLSISLPLLSNTVYTAVVTVTTENNETTSSSVSFDTITPTYTFEAEDFNYTSNGISGLFIDNPQTNAYANLGSAFDVDFYNTNYNNGTNGGPSDGTALYRPQGLETEVAGDTARLPYVGTTNVDYDVGFATPGNWADYTRTFPAGVYNIYLRGSDGNNTNQIDAASMFLVASNSATTNQNVILLGTFTVPGVPGNWDSYADAPLIDPDGNYAEFVGGSVETLRATTDAGNYNANYYLLMPAENSLPVNPPHLRASYSGSNVVVSFLSRTNTVYQLQSSASLTSPSWTPVGSTVSGNSLTESLTNAPGSGSGFYRLQTVSQ